MSSYIKLNETSQEYLNDQPAELAKCVLANTKAFLNDPDISNDINEKNYYLLLWQKLRQFNFPYRRQIYVTYDFVLLILVEDDPQLLDNIKLSNGSCVVPPLLFDGCTFVDEIRLAENTSVIGYRSFADATMKKIIIPSTQLIHINDLAFNIEYGYIDEIEFTNITLNQFLDIIAESNKDYNDVLGSGIGKVTFKD